MEFPRIVHKRGGEYLFVADQAAYDAALEDGWVASSRAFDGVSTEPLMVVPVEDVAPPVVPVADPDPVPKKRGRPRKTE